MQWLQVRNPGYDYDKVDMFRLPYVTIIPGDSQTRCHLVFLHRKLRVGNLYVPKTECRVFSCYLFRNLYLVCTYTCSDSTLEHFPSEVCVLTLILLMWTTGWANSIAIYIQKDTTLHSLFIFGNCSTCFGWYLHPSSEAHTTVPTASGICHTLTAIWRYRGRVGTGLSVLWVAYATHSTLKPVPTLPR
jgi:hypothetical protein